MSDAQRGSGEVGRAHVQALARCALVVLSGPERGRSCELAGDVFHIGKGAENDLVLTDATVSRRHCQIRREGAGLLLRDLDSTNGTMLDGANIKEAWLKAGAVLTVGDVELGVRALPEHGESPEDARTFAAGQSYRETRAAWEADFERRYVTWLLARHGGNISAAAREADMDRKYLHRLALKHAVHPGPRARR